MIFLVIYQQTLPQATDCVIRSKLFTTHIANIKSDYDAIDNSQTIITANTLLTSLSFPISNFTTWRTAVQPLLDNDTLASVAAAADTSAKQVIKDEYTE